MRVFIAGATGFIGSRLAHALCAEGHQLVCAVRDTDSTRASPLPGRVVRGDFACDQTAEHWLPLLAGVDVVINAVGILRERAGQSFDDLHVAGPRALFTACAQAGVPRVVQISALGADAEARSGYHRSKKQADDLLLSLLPTAIVVQPSLVYGAGGSSATLFDTLASLPLIPLPGRGMQTVQPLHVDDLVDALAALVGGAATGAQHIAAVGPQPLALRDFLQSLRLAMGLQQGRLLPVPMPLVRIAARLARHVPVAFDAETLSMLERGNAAPVTGFARLLGRMPRPVSRFLAGDAGQAALRARLGWLLPLLRWSIAAVWIWTAVVSLGLFPVADSYALLARLGITGALAPLALYGAAALDFGLGMATLLLRRRRVLWLTQLAVIGAYTALITVGLPEYWLHPYGPVLKNLPLMACIGLLLVLERR